MTAHRDMTPNEATTTSSQSTEAAASLRDKAQEAGQELSHQARRLGAQGQAMASDYYQQGREQAMVWQEHLEQHIREKPIQSLLIAGGVGVLIGMLLRR